jgi:tetratricopeptide (TPR) repeat protein
MDVVETFGRCPRCSNTMDFRIQPVICSQCGWMPESGDKKVAAQLNKKFMVWALGIGVFLILAYMHVVHWGEHAMEVLPLKVQSVLGVAGPASLERLAKICEDRFKFDCSVDALSSATQKNPTAESFTKLGLFQLRMKTYDSALRSYEKALEVATNDPATPNALKSDIHYGLAKAADNMKQSDLALTHYQAAIDAKPEVVLVSVTEDYLRLLQGLGKKDEVKAVVGEARKRGGSPSLFSSFLEVSPQ